jgi:two-component system cell cycle response regulator CpdR
VDDDAIVRDAVAMMLRVDGHQVDSAGDWAEAIALLRGATYDVLLWDLGVSDPAQPEERRELRKRWTDARDRLIFMTGHVDHGGRGGVLKEFGRRVLAKPFTLETLRAAIHGTLAAPGG